MKIKCPQCKNHFENMDLCSESKCFFDLHEDRIEIPTLTDPKSVELKDISERLDFPEVKMKRPLFNRIQFRTRKIRKFVQNCVYSLVFLITGLTLHNMDITDFTLAELLITLSGILISFVIGYFIEGPTLKAKVNAIVNLLAEELVKATDQASEQGRKITKGEAIAIVESVVKQVLNK